MFRPPSLIGNEKTFRYFLLFFGNNLSLGTMETESRTMFFSIRQNSFSSYDESRQRYHRPHTTLTIKQASKSSINAIMAIPYIGITRGSPWVLPSSQSFVCLLINKLGVSRNELHME